VWLDLCKDQQDKIQKYCTDPNLPGGIQQVEQVQTSSPSAGTTTGSTTNMSEADCQQIAAMITRAMSTTNITISNAGTAFGGKSKAIGKKSGN
jgi:hypothetical protein